MAKHEASRSLTYHALRLFAAGQNAIREVTEAKLIASAPPTRRPTALRIHGGADRRSTGSSVLRDTRLGPIGGGTDEVMKEILGRQSGCSREPSGQRPCSSK